MKIQILTVRRTMRLFPNQTLRVLSAVVCFCLMRSVASAQVQYTYTTSGTLKTGDWSVAAAWSTPGDGSVPNDVANSKVSILSGSTVTVSAGESYATGYIGFGSGGTLYVTGTGAKLTLGKLGSSGTNSMQTGASSVVSITSGATITASGILSNSGKFSITNASVTFSSVQFGSSGTQQVVLNEGARLTLSSITTGSSTAGALVFNGGTSGFGELAIAAMRAGSNLVPTLSINSGSYHYSGSGTDTFTLISATSWTGSFTSITFNGSSYTLGTDVSIDGNEIWNISRVGNSLVLTVVPEPESAHLVFAFFILGALVLRFSKRRQLRA
jgi:hypothetical protein